MSKKDTKLSEAEIIADLFDYISHDTACCPYLSDVPKFPKTYKVYKPDPGKPGVLLEVSKNQAKIIDPSVAEDHLFFLISQWEEGKHAIYKSYIKPHQCGKIFRMFRSLNCHYTELPKAIGFADDPELVMTRLKFNPMPNVTELNLAKKAPTFYEILSRIQINRQALAAMLGSLYDPQADRKQIAYVWGPGNAGKSVIAEIIKLLVGSNAFAVLSPDTMRSSFWKASVLGKRAVVINEGSSKFLRTSTFKSFTGDDVHSINEKGQPIFQSRIDAISFIFSNEKPVVPNDDAIIERVIDCRIEPIKIEDRQKRAVVIKKLTEEIEAIAGYCVAAYEQFKDKPRIEADTSKIEIEDEYEDIDEWIHRTFVLDKNKHFDGDYTEGGGLALGVVSDAIKAQFGAYNQTVSKVKARLCDVMKVKAQQVRVNNGNDRVRIYRNLRFKTEEEKRYSID